MYDCKKCPGYCCSYPLIALTSATWSGWRSTSASRSKPRARQIHRRALGTQVLHAPQGGPDFRAHLPLLRHREAPLHGLRSAASAMPQLSGRALRLLRLPILRAPCPRRPRIRGHHRQQISQDGAPRGYLGRAAPAARAGARAGPALASGQADPSDLAARAADGPRASAGGRAAGVQSIRAPRAYSWRAGALGFARSSDAIKASSATNVSTAPAAWEYSHCRRAASN